MNVPPDIPSLVAGSAVLLSWFGFGAILIIGKRGAAQAETKREMRSHLGFALQFCAYAVCFVFHRPFFSPLAGSSRSADAALAIMVVSLAAGSDWFCLVAARQLGKQWALAARVVEGHELIRQGPYAVVRNPIYLAMFVNLLAAAMAFSRWPGFIAALGIFYAGTEIRIRSEEKLMRATFGEEFEEYAQRVPAFLPRKW